MRRELSLLLLLSSLVSVWVIVQKPLSAVILMRSNSDIILSLHALSGLSEMLSDLRVGLLHSFFHSHRKIIIGKPMADLLGFQTRPTGALTSRENIK